MVKFKKTVFVIDEKVSLHLHYDGCYLLIMGIVIPVTMEGVEWGANSRPLYQSVFDNQMERLVVRAVYEFHNPVQIEIDEKVAA